jgi:hypothetical protein
LTISSVLKLTVSLVAYHQAADTRAREELSLRESKLEQPLLPRDQKGLDAKDIIGTREKFASLADLYYTTVRDLFCQHGNIIDNAIPLSQRWFVNKLRELKRVREELTSPGGEELHSEFVSLLQSN